MARCAVKFTTASLDRDEQMTERHGQRFKSPCACGWFNLCHDSTNLVLTRGPKTRVQLNSHNSSIKIIITRSGSVEASMRFYNACLYHYPSAIRYVSSSLHLLKFSSWCALSRPTHQPSSTKTDCYSRKRHRRLLPL